MAIDPTAFIVNYPEFTNAPSPLIANELANAYLQCPSDLWGSYIDIGAQLRAAQALALSPFGRGMALSNDEGKTVYDSRLEMLEMTVAAGGRLL